jgi:hypothetical protein
MLGAIRAVCLSIISRVVRDASARNLMHGRRAGWRLSPTSGRRSRLPLPRAGRSGEVRLVEVFESRPEV